MSVKQLPDWASRRRLMELSEGQATLHNGAEVVALAIVVGDVVKVAAGEEATVGVTEEVEIFRTRATTLILHPLA